MNKIISIFSICIAIVFGLIFSSHQVYSLKCDNVETTLLSCPEGDTETLGGVGEILKVFVNILKVLIGALAVAALTYAGVLYGTAAGNSEQIKKSISYIRNTVIGLIAYAVMWLVLKWLIPGFDVSFF